MKTSIGKKKISRILYLKIFYGDEFIDYIKDDYGVERFLREELDKEDVKSRFFKTTLLVKEFTTQWLIFTAYYKNRFGQQIRDKDVVSKLSRENKFKKIPNLYSFRCRLFKSDFFPDDSFYNELKTNLALIKKLNSDIFKRKEKRNKYFIENTKW